MDLPAVCPVGADEHLAPGGSRALEERLERGDVLLFAPGQLPLPPEEDLAFLRGLGGSLTLKNISYHPEGDYLSGIERGEARTRTRAILRERDRVVRGFLGERLADYAADWRVGKVNFRPLEERGRDLPRHSSNELLHVDAFASGATHGDRVLRFFTNIHPSEARVWRSAGLFPELYREFGAAAGVSELGARGLAPSLPERAFSGFLQALARVGVAQPLMADTSPYDRAMHRFHNHLKDDDAFQRDEARCVRMEFAPFSSWAVLTDMVSHAAVSGRHALVDTFYVRRGRCVRPELAPYNIMAGA